MMKKLTVLYTFALMAMLLTSSAAVAASSTLTLKGSYWKVFNYPMSPTSMTYTMVGHPATTSTGVAFNFPDADIGNYTAQLLASYKIPMTATMTISATFTLTGDGTFVGSPSGGCPDSSSSLCPGDVRLFFESSTAAGFGAFDETNAWWSNGGAAAPYCQLSSSSPTTCTITATLNGANWSDFYGHFGNDPSYSAGFASSIQHVKLVGLSFGSGYFFANGVGVDYTTGSVTFTLTSFSIA